MTTALLAAPEIKRDLPSSLYHGDAESVSIHGLIDFRRSPLHHQWNHRRGIERPDTAAQRLGTAIHMAVLEPERFASHYAVRPACDRRTNAGKATYAAFLDTLGDREEIDPDDHACAARVAEAVQRHPMAKELLAQGTAEASIYWTDRSTGVRCRMRPDFISDRGPFLVDLKSASDAGERAFMRSAWSYGYHMTAAFYIDGYRELTGETREYVFAAWEKDEPHASAWYYAEQDFIKAGHDEYKALLVRYARCLDADRWPGYPAELQPLYLPQWAVSE